MRTTDNNGGKPLNDFDNINAKIPALMSCFFFGISLNISLNDIETPHS